MKMDGAAGFAGGVVWPSLLPGRTILAGGAAHVSWPAVRLQISRRVIVKWDRSGRGRPFAERCRSMAYVVFAAQYLLFYNNCVFCEEWGNLMAAWQGYSREDFRTCPLRSTADCIELSPSANDNGVCFWNKGTEGIQPPCKPRPQVHCLTAENHWSSIRCPSGSIFQFLIPF